MDELITLKAAGELVGKSPSTIRRWVRAGKLTRHEGVQVSGGGSPPVMVAKHQLLAHVGSSEGVQSDEQVSNGHVQPSSRTPMQVSTQRPEDAVRIAELEGQVNTLRAQLEAATSRMESERASHEAQLRDLRQSLHEARSDVTDWRDRHDRAAAELRTLRETSGRSWWRRLLPGPSGHPGDA